MIRLPVPKGRIADRVTLLRAERHYLLDVLRLAPGAKLEVFDGEGGRYPAALEPDGSLSLGAREEALHAGRRLALAQALAKGDKMDLVVQKATELGVDRISPFTSSRCVVRLGAAKAEDRVVRWQRIAEEAARQCGRADVPQVAPVQPLEAMIGRHRAEGSRVLLLFEHETARGLSQALLASADPLVLVVGPEGGFAGEEIAAARSQGAEIVSLGPLILRTETAGLAAIAVTRFLDGELG